MTTESQVRRRATLVSWWFAPLTIAGVAVWFLFNMIVCMDGQSGPITLLVCSQFNILPDLLGVALVVSLGWLVLALRDLEVATGSMGGDVFPEEDHDSRHRVMRDAAKARRHYDVLAKPDRDEVWFAIEMSAWSAAIMIGTLIFYWFEIAFPLATVVLLGLATLSVRVGALLIARMRGQATKGKPASRPPTSSRPAPAS